MRRPEFTIVAGPNGAGKSSLAPLYVNITPFDGDKMVMQLRKEHPDWSEEWVRGAVAQELQRQKEEVMSKHESFAFETNFSNDMAENMVKEFKEKGYKVSLCYFGIPSVRDSIARVIQRKKAGGHGVDDEVVSYNFYEGLSRCRKNINLFDNVTFVDSKEKYGNIVAIHIGNSNIHKISPDAPEWFRDQFQEVFESLTEKPQIVSQGAENTVDMTQECGVVETDTLLDEAVQAVIERITDGNASSFSDTQIEALEEFKSDAEDGNMQERFVELWRTVTEELEDFRSVPQKWIDDVLQELRDFWDGEPLRQSTGRHR